MKVQECRTAMPGDEILSRAKSFFSERVPHMAAYPEREGPTWLTLRGQGGEEIALSVHPGEGETVVRASSLLFGQQISRFFSTLPSPAGVA